MIVAPEPNLLLYDLTERSEKVFFGSLGVYQRTLKEWRQAFDNPSPDFQRFLEQTFGPDAENLARHTAVYERVLDLAQETLEPDTRVWLIGCEFAAGEGGPSESEVAMAVASSSEDILQTIYVDRERLESEDTSIRDDEVKRCQDAVFAAFEAVARRFPGCRTTGARIVLGGFPFEENHESISTELAVVLVLAAVAAHGLRLDRQSVIECVREVLALSRDNDVDRILSRAGFIHPPIRPEDYVELWEHQVTSSLRSAEEQAVDKRDWPALERTALQEENIAFRCLSFERSNLPIASDKETFLVTGGAGFIGSNVARRLLKEGCHVVVLDDFNDYYDPFLKFESVSDLFEYPGFELVEGDFRDLHLLERLFASRRIDQIVHLGARAGVRPSIDDPQLYVSTNVLGTQNLLEMARRYKVTNFVYASSSSVYGGSEEIPFRESRPVDEPISPYAATKKANEAQAACYHQLYGFPVTGLRLFTVYGPGGRPDMAIRKFIEKMDRGESVPMYGDGTFERDYTYIDDIVEGIIRAARVSVGKKGWCEIINLGESDTTNVRELILLIAKALQVIQLESDPRDLPVNEVKRRIEELVSVGRVERLPEQPGDVPKTYADVSKAKKLLGYDPQTDVGQGIERTVLWHQTRDRSFERRWGDALRLYAQFKQRAGLDGLGQPRDPLYTEEDLKRAIELRNRIERLVCVDPEDRGLGLWILAGCCGVIGEIAAYLRSDDPKRPWGLTGLAVHRRRLSILKQIHAAAGRPLLPDEQERILTGADEINHTCGVRETALVVAAAGLGRRMAEHVGGLGQKHRLFLGDEMLLLSLRNALPFAKRIVVVVGEDNRDDIAETLARSEISEQNGFQVDFVIQNERLGDGDAHLTAAQALEDFDGVVLFVFADAPTKSPETLRKMLVLKQALGHLVPLVVPTLVVERPYAPVVTSDRWPDRGAVIWNWQKADETSFEQARKARNSSGATNVGLFCAESFVFDYLRRYKHEFFQKTEAYENWQQQRAQRNGANDTDAQARRNPEFGFADSMKILSSCGLPVAAPTLALRSDRLNVNDGETADAVRDFLRQTRPRVRVEIKKNVEDREVIVCFVDLDADGVPVLTLGTPYHRNYACLRFEEDLSSPSVMNAVREHIRSLTERIQTELGLDVLWDGEV